MKFGSVCSGIEAASVAWNPLGWEAEWFAEIEAFPSAVLAHHFPHVRNVGDMIQLPEMIRNGEVNTVDVFCGGTPCQSFSFAGKRQSLDDDRGNLSLTFCEIADANDDVRLAAGKQAGIIFWENVPGVLSTKDNAFGCLLGALSGHGGGLTSEFGKWDNAGIVIGSRRTVAWRVLDAQFFGVPQRRKRVFVIASARDDFDPAEVLFEFAGLSGDSEALREAREETSEDVARCADSDCVAISTKQLSLMVTNDCANTLGANDYKEPQAVAYTASSFANYTEGVGTLRAQGGDMGGGSETLILVTKECS